MKISRPLKRYATYLFWTFRPLRRSFHKHNLPNRLIISLTSHPSRYRILYATLKCLLLQDVSPDAIILWVSEPDSLFLPRRIKALTRAGLEIRICRDFRSYNKILPALAAYPDAFIVTADDDSFYPPGWLRSLVTEYDASVKEIICHRAHKLRLAADGRPLPYFSWELMTSDIRRSERIFPTGVGGVLYAPNVLHPGVADSPVFQKLSPTADDVWLFWMALLNGACARRTGQPPENWMWPTRSRSLFDANRLPSGNDAQIANMVEAFGLPRLHRAPSNEDAGATPLLVARWAPSGMMAVRR